MEELTQGTAEPGLPAEPPRGMFTCKLDDRSRLKLPADLVAFFNSLSEKKLFVTSLDRNIAQIYPMSVWRKNEKLIANHVDDPEAAEIVGFNANDLGGTVEIDAQGRIVFPQALREELKLDGQTLKLYAVQEHIDVLTEPVYNELKQAAAPGAKASALKLKKAGLV
jgi:DNA-binding transcriptional regulator/RsmH inhibitor MraZ